MSAQRSVRPMSRTPLQPTARQQARPRTAAAAARPDDAGRDEADSLRTRSRSRVSREGWFKLKSASRRLNRIRRKVYRENPVATGETGRATALALWRAVTKKGFRAWCYEFGFCGSLTHTVTIVDADDALPIHDAFFNLTYRRGFHEVLDALRDGRPVAAKIEIRDRKIYVMDPAFEPRVQRSLARNERRQGTRAGRRPTPIRSPLERRGVCRDGPGRRCGLPGTGGARLSPRPAVPDAASDRDVRRREILSGRRPICRCSPAATWTRRWRRCASGSCGRIGSWRRSASAARNVMRSSRGSKANATPRSPAWRRLPPRRERLGDQVVQLRAALDDENARLTAEREALQQALTEARAQSRAYEAEIADAISELSRVRADWNAERRAWECDLAELRAAAGMWIEQSSDALRTARSERDAALGERQQAAADRDHARAELSARLQAWENTRWRRFRALVTRVIKKWP